MNNAFPLPTPERRVRRAEGTLNIDEIDLPAGVDHPDLLPIWKPPRMTKRPGSKSMVISRRFSSSENVSSVTFHGVDRQSAASNVE